MPGIMPATSQLEWLSSTTAMIVLSWSRATRDLLKSFGWGIAGTPSIRYSDEVAIPRRPPHSVYWSPLHGTIGPATCLRILRREQHPHHLPAVPVMLDHFTKHATLTANKAAVARQE